eukprot:2588309-Prymnesium_polylepis.1
MRATSPVVVCAVRHPRRESSRSFSLSAEGGRCVKPYRVPGGWAPGWAAPNAYSCKLRNIDRPYGSTQQAAEGRAVGRGGPR